MSRSFIANLNGWSGTVTKRSLQLIGVVLLHCSLKLLMTWNVQEYVIKLEIRVQIIIALTSYVNDVHLPTLVGNAFVSLPCVGQCMNDCRWQMVRSRAIAGLHVIRRFPRYVANALVLPPLDQGSVRAHDPPCTKRAVLSSVFYEKKRGEKKEIV